jgi:hypothetical protein
VEELKAFYLHLATSVVFNLFLNVAEVVYKIIENKSCDKTFSDYGMYAVWIIWGIGFG